MANLTITNTLAPITTIASAALNTNFSDVKSWLNNRDNATDFWLNMKVSGTASNPAEIKSSSTDCEFDIDCTGTNGTPRLSWRRSGTTYFTMGVDGAASNNLKIGTSALTTSNALVINQSSSAVSIRGTNTNDSATAGFIGETISSNITSAQLAGSSNTYFNVTNISLTAGDWLVCGQVRFSLNGATVTNCRGAVSAFSGNTTTDHLSGVNDLQTLPPTSAADTCVTIANWRVSIASTTTIYVKGFFTYSPGNPQYYGNIIAVRIR